MSIKIDYFTDPICSYCYAFEPVLKKLENEYEDRIEIIYHMGGLLKNWDGFSDSGNGISKPSDVANHWDHVAKQTGVSINSDVWRINPIKSSYPSCISYYVILKLKPEVASSYLSAIRKAVFVDCQNIGNIDVLANVAEKFGIDRDEFLKEMSNPVNRKTFKDDMMYMIHLSVSGFPTLVVSNNEKTTVLSGLNHYNYYKEFFDSYL